MGKVSGQEHTDLVINGPGSVVVRCGDRPPVTLAFDKPLTDPATGEPNYPVVMPLTGPILLSDDRTEPHAEVVVTALRPA